MTTPDAERDAVELVERVRRTLRQPVKRPSVRRDDLSALLDRLARAEAEAKESAQAISGLLDLMEQEWGGVYVPSLRKAVVEQARRALAGSKP